MSELEDALRRARAELAETNTAIKTARGELVEVLEAELASLRAEAAKLDLQVEVQEAAVQTLREQEQGALGELSPPPAREGA